jgi:hypothetical protein
MSSFVYTTAITQVDASTINFAIPSVMPSVTVITPVLSTLTNLSTAVVHDMLGDFMTSPLPNNYDLDSTVAGMGAVFGDAVYYYQGEFDAGADTYTSEAFLLNLTAIDAAIPLMPQTTGREIATYNAAVSIRQDIQDYFDATNYNNATIWINYLTNLVAGVSSGGALTPVATLPASVTINTELADTTAVFPNAFGYYNVITNTLTNVEYPYTWAFAPNSSSPQDNDTTQVASYPDGVYTDYVSVLCTFDDEGNYPAILNEGTSYLLVTTFITEQIELFEANYNPNDPNQVNLLAELQEEYALIQTYFDDENYEGANDQIEIVQTLLESVTLCAGLSAVLASGTTNQIVLTYPSLPAGTYSEQSGTLTNSITGEEYIFTGFPANSSNNQLTLNSNTIGAGSSFADGVWQVTNTFVNVATFQCVTYALVVTNARCCVRKAQAKSATCRNLSGRAEELNSWLETAIDEFNYSAYSVSNGFIKKINAVCSSCGCGC